MIHGMDTGMLVALEHSEHTDHAAAQQMFARLIAAGDFVGLAPQVLTEFMHVVTDKRRFVTPLDMTVAQQLAQQWWTATEVVHVLPDAAAVTQLLTWVKQYSLGRKRLLDTLLAATYHQADIHSLLTTNPADFAVFGRFTCITPASPQTP